MHKAQSTYVAFIIYYNIFRAHIYLQTNYAWEKKNCTNRNYL